MRLTLGEMVHFRRDVVQNLLLELMDGIILFFFTRFHGFLP